MALNPQFHVDDIIYRISSAERGFLESHRIAEVRQTPSGAWVYLIAVPNRPPTAVGTVGDRVTLKKTYDFTLDESELTTLCGAVPLAIAFLQAELTKMRAVQAAYCPESGS